MAQDTSAQAARNNNRTHTPQSPSFRDFMGSDWGERPPQPQRYTVADYLPARHKALSQKFPHARLVIPAGPYKTRSNDTTYRFRAHSAFAHMSGLGAEHEPDAVLVFNPVDENHEVTLYFHPQASRSSEEFYKDSQYGEFWVGARATLDDMHAMLGIPCAPLDTLPDMLAKLTYMSSPNQMLRLKHSLPTSVNKMAFNAHKQATIYLPKRSPNCV